MQRGRHSPSQNFELITARCEKVIVHPGLMPNIAETNIRTNCMSVSGRAQPAHSDAVAIDGFAAEQYGRRISLRENGEPLAQSALALS